MADFKENVKRFQSNSEAAKLDDSATPTSELAGGISRLTSELHQASQPKRENDGLKGRRFAIIYKSISVRPADISDPNILNVYNSIKREDASDASNIFVVMHYGLAAGTTGVVMGNEIEDLTKMSRFYELLGNAASESSLDRAGHFVEVEMRGVDYGVVKHFVGDGATSAEVNVPGAGGGDGGVDDPSNPSGTKVSPNYVGRKVHDTIKSTSTSATNPKPGAAFDLLMTDKDKGSFFYRGAGPGDYKNYHKLLWSNSLYDEAKKYPGLMDKYGVIISTRGSDQFRQYFDHRKEAERTAGITYLKELLKNFNSRLKPEKVGIKCWGGKQDLYKIAADWIGNGQWIDVMEHRLPTQAPPSTHPAGKPQPVCGTHGAILGLLRMEKVWTALRIKALENKQIDFGSLVQQTYNGFRGCALGLNRSNDGLRKKKNVINWCKDGIVEKKNGSKLKRWTASDHGTGMAFDIQCIPQHSPRQTSGWRENWRRFLFFVTLMQWERGGGSCKKVKGVKKKFGGQTYHYALRNTFGRGDKPNAHIGMRNSAFNVSWKYGPCPTLPEMGSAGHLTITSVYKDGKNIQGMSMNNVDRPNLKKMDAWLPGWRKVCQDNNCWPAEWTAGGSS